MNLAVRDEREVSVVTLSSALDFYYSPVFKKEMAGMIEEGRPNVVLDMSTVNFVDSSGLGALLAILRQANRVRGDVKLVGLRPNVKAVMELTRLDKMFDVFPDVRAAVESFRSAKK
jgi:anti-sigma B factor antagonist